MRDRTRMHRVRWVTLIRCKDGRQMDKTETRLIGRYRPELNIAGIPPASVTPRTRTRAADEE